MGFEPTRGLRPHTVSSRAHSATMRPFRARSAIVFPQRVYPAARLLDKGWSNSRRSPEKAVKKPSGAPRWPQAGHTCYTLSLDSVSRSEQLRLTQSGGGGGIRTHEALVTPTAFRERHLKPLGHPSTCQMQGRSPAYYRYARRDSNPRPLGPQPNALSTELRAHDTFSDAGVRSTGTTQYSMRGYLVARGWRASLSAQDTRRCGNDPRPDISEIARVAAVREQRKATG